MQHMYTQYTHACLRREALCPALGDDQRAQLAAAWGGHVQPCCHVTAAFTAFAAALMHVQVHRSCRTVALGLRAVQVVRAGTCYLHMQALADNMCRLLSIACAGSYQACKPLSIACAGPCQPCGRCHSHVQALVTCTRGLLSLPCDCCACMQPARSSCLDLHVPPPLGILVYGL